jgi:hypothetical protein
VRIRDKGRAAVGDRVTPIVAFASHTERSSFVTDLVEPGVSTFVARTLTVNLRIAIDGAVTTRRRSIFRVDGGP